MNARLTLILALSACVLLAACTRQADRSYAVSYHADYGEREFLYAADNRDLDLILHGVDDSGYALSVPALDGPPLPRVAGQRSMAFATLVTDTPDNSMVLPYSLTLIVNPVMLADDGDICRSRLPPTRGPTAETTRLHAVMCRAHKPLSSVVADADADLFAVAGLDTVVHEMTTIMANPRRREDIAATEQRRQSPLIVYEYPE